MNLGIIISNYNCADLIPKFFESWIEYKNKYPENQIFFYIIDTKFVGNDDNNPNFYSNDGSIDKLVNYKNQGIIDYLEISHKPLSEIEARTILLKKILEDKNPDWILTTAFDEEFAVEQIEKIINYIKKDILIGWYALQYKNFIWDKQHYLLGFNPPRLFKTKYNKFKLDSFYEDDGTAYINEQFGNKLFSFKDFPNKIIPNIQINHYTWLNNERSRLKILYQEKRWNPPNGFGCSFTWNEETKSVDLNDNYFRLTHTEKPIIYTE